MDSFACRKSHKIDRKFFWGASIFYWWACVIKKVFDAPHLQKTNALHVQPSRRAFDLSAVSNYGEFDLFVRFGRISVE